MAVLTKNTEIVVRDIKNFVKAFNSQPNPSKSAFERIQKAKKDPIYRNDK
ncbi:hypothetical protein Javan126_0050 [Streptococcus phage Javan126]|nr:hypothetical protein [Streptococcus dysgalactiae]QBX14330.1 hypothetical protein Javan133_0055 [Streptococcus phage Javan133]QBX23371.1 hypothetical protein Javan126_0050 [Streptococcus phage Javan126]QBX23868.1 hypothetical protein Javan164_0051 [Streptococcus phage Javan164]